MPWLPHFLNAWPAAAAAAVAIPTLLILYFLKLRRKEMAVSSTLLWKKAIQDLQVNAPFQRLRRNLLLLLQMLVLILLLLALARPILNYTPGAGQVTVILIDRSASMGATDADGHTRLDEAKSRAKDLVSTLGRNASAMVIAFDQTAEPVQAFTGDQAALRNAIDSIKQTDRPTKLKDAYQLAEAQSAYLPQQLRSNAVTPDVWLFSDGKATDTSTLSLHATLHYEKIGSDQPRNIAVVALSAKRDYQRPNEVQVFCRLANYGSEPVRGVQVQLSVDGEFRGAAEATLLPQSWNEEQIRKAAEAGTGGTTGGITFPSIELTTAAVIKVEQMYKGTDGEGKPLDNLAADDSAWVVVPPPKQLSVLLVTDENFFLQKALDAQKLRSYDTMFPPQYEQAMAGGKLPKDYDVVIFDRYSPKKLPEAGNFMYFGAIPPATDLKAALGADGQPILTHDNTVLDWSRDHPILRGLKLDRLGIRTAMKLLPTMNSEVLMEGASGPLMILHRQGRGVHLVVPFDLWESDWPTRASFPVFIHNALQFMALGTDMNVRESYQPGATPLIPAYDLAKLEPRPQNLTLNGPDGTRTVPLTGAGQIVLPALDHVGVYKTNPPVPQYEQIAVNLLDPNESNIAPVPADKFPGGEGGASAVAGGKARLDLWWWLVAAGALPILMVEWWVYTRRVHL